MLSLLLSIFVFIVFIGIVFAFTNWFYDWLVFNSKFTTMIQDTIAIFYAVFATLSILVAGLFILKLPH